MDPSAVIGRLIGEARSLAGLGQAITQRLPLVDKIEREAAEILALAGRFLALGEAILERGGQIDARAGEILALGERIDARAAAILALGDRIDARGEAIHDLGERIDARGAEMVALGERLDSRGEAIIELGTGVLEVGREMLPEARLVHERAGELVTHADQLVAVLPTLEHAVSMATPLEGAVDRLGRIVDRLPGDSRRRRPPNP